MHSSRQRPHLQTSPRQHPLYFSLWIRVLWNKLLKILRSSFVKLRVKTLPFFNFLRGLNKGSSRTNILDLNLRVTFYRKHLGLILALYPESPGDLVLCTGQEADNENQFYYFPANSKLEIVLNSVWKWNGSFLLISLSLLQNIYLNEVS